MTAPGLPGLRHRYRRRPRPGLPVGAAVGARNTLDLLSLAGAASVPVAVGAHDPLAGSFGGGSPWVPGENGVGEVVLAPAAASVVAESAAEMLVLLART